MKKITILFFVVMMSFVMHKYYVSVTEIVYNEKSKLLEISLKVFNDDWQNALDYKLGRPVNLGSINEYESIDSLASAYVKENFKLKINDEYVEINILGKELESESTWIYMFVDDVINIETIEIQNTLLTEMFDEQRNVIQLKIGKINKSALLTKSRNSKKFVIKK